MTEKTSDFLLKEYERISEAHFNTSNQISLFFRYYLTLMSVPALLLLYIDKDINIVKSIFDTKDEFWLNHYLGILCILISIIGLALTVYLTKLKFEHILYARTVNGIRKYFNSKDATLKEFLVLPTDVGKPSFIGLGFGSLIVVNALVNSSYFTLALHLLKVNCSLFLGITLFAIHIVGYLGLNFFEERKMTKLK